MFPNNQITCLTTHTKCVLSRLITGGHFNFPQGVVWVCNEWLNILICTKITEVNLSALVYRLFHEDLSSLIRTKSEQNELTAVIFVHIALHWALYHLMFPEQSWNIYSFFSQQSVFSQGKLRFIGIHHESFGDVKGESYKMSKYTTISEVNLSKCTYRLFHEAFSSMMLEQLQNV